MYEKLSDLPISINETGYNTLSPLQKAVDLLEKSQDRDWYIEHFDQSLSLIDNIKNAITVYSDNRVQFTK